MSSEPNKHAKQDRYEKQLRRMYKGFIVLSEESEFIGYDIAVAHRCLLCGETVSTRPMTLLNYKRVENKRTNEIEYKPISDEGRGCIVCRTTSKQMRELADFEKQLKIAHKGKFALAYFPQRFERDSGKYKQTFRCNECGSQHYQTPSTILDAKFQCEVCLVQKRQGERTKFYIERLKQLYSGQIVLRKQYRDKEELLHECDKRHMWRATAASMLNGAGCPHCKNSVSVKHTEPYKYRSKTYRFRNDRELKAFPVLLEKLKDEHRYLRTSLEFPTPILFGKHAVAFFDTKNRLVVDVMSYKAFKKNQRRKLPASLDRAAELGLTYAVILVTRSGSAGRWTRDDVLSTTTKKVPKMLISKIIDNKEGDEDGDIPF